MVDNEWSITPTEGYNLICDVFRNILSENENVTIHMLCVLMSKELNYNNIFLYRNKKRRNLNNYMKLEFNGIQSFLKKNSDKFKLSDKYVVAV